MNKRNPVAANKFHWSSFDLSGIQAKKMDKKQNQRIPMVKLVE